MRLILSAVAALALAAPAHAQFADLTTWRLWGDGLVTPAVAALSTETDSYDGCYYAVEPYPVCSNLTSPVFQTVGGTVSFDVRFNGDPTAPAEPYASFGHVFVARNGRGYLQTLFRVFSHQLPSTMSTGVQHVTATVPAGRLYLVAVVGRNPNTTTQGSLVIRNVVLPAAAAPTVTPEPATLALVGGGLLALAGAARRRARR